MRVVFARAVIAHLSAWLVADSLVVAGNATVGCAVGVLIDDRGGVCYRLFKIRAPKIHFVSTAQVGIRVDTADKNRMQKGKI